jgi:hypothetical protein
MVRIRFPPPASPFSPVPSRAIGSATIRRAHTVHPLSKGGTEMLACRSFQACS